MSRQKSRVFSRSFKLAAVRRMLAGENVSALSRELQVQRKDLYHWRTRFRAGGPEALRGKGRPRGAEDDPARSQKPPGDLEAARQRIAELERKIGQQQVDLDFFRQALRRVGAARQRNGGRGGRASTGSSKR
jgi:transposase-like protein